jgi:hypothetical protein
MRVHHMQYNLEHFNLCNQTLVYLLWILPSTDKPPPATITPNPCPPISALMSGFPSVPLNGITPNVPLIVTGLVFRFVTVAVWAPVVSGLKLVRKESPNSLLLTTLPFGLVIVSFSLIPEMAAAYCPLRSMPRFPLVKSSSPFQSSCARLNPYDRRCHCEKQIPYDIHDKSMLLLGHLGASNIKSPKMDTWASNLLLTQSSS